VQTIEHDDSPLLSASIICQASEASQSPGSHIQYQHNHNAVIMLSKIGQRK